MSGFEFYESIKPFSDFAEVGESAHYHAAPDDWVVGACDVVRSTEAIGAGRYKAVNMAGASVIAAAMNALGRQRFPFAFGGDGAVFAAPGEERETLATALAAVRDWADEALGLTLRVALAPVSAIRAKDRDVRIARFAASPDVDYAMFDGGGAAWLEAEMKAEQTEPLPSTPGADPDLSGLSCRWAPMVAQRGVILSLIALPAGDGSAAADAFRPTMRRVLDMFEAEDRAANPVPAAGPELRTSEDAMRLEAQAAGVGGDEEAALKGIKRESWIAKILFMTGIPAGGLRPRRYRKELVANSDVRKFDDGLKMTVDCTTALADRVEALLAEAERDGLCRFGVHRQDQAIMTCLVPDYTRPDHMHFVDGASGGYAMAAARMKEKMRSEDQ